MSGNKHIGYFYEKENCRCIFLKLSLNVPYKALLQSTVSKNKIKKIGHHSRKRDTMGQSCPIYACTRANVARYSLVHVTFCCS